MHRFAIAAVVFAACTPSVSSGEVRAIDDKGDPITTFEVPLEPVGGSMVVMLTLENLGGSTAAPIALAMSGDVGGDFTILGGCTGTPLDPGHVCMVQLEFMAAHEGKHVADLDITADGMARLELDTDVFKPAP